MFRRLGQLLRLDPVCRWLLVQAWLSLATAWWALRTRPFGRLVRSFESHRGSIDVSAPAEEDLLRARLVGWAVRTAARFTPWRSTCLVQVLAAQRMLERRSIPGVIYIGAAPGDDSGGRLDAHAWLKCGDAFITGEGSHERYIVVLAFSWS